MKIGSTILPLCVCVVVICVLCQNVEGAKNDIKRISLSLPDMKIGEGDRISEFKATILNGSVVSVPRIPDGWFFRVDLPYQWKTVVTAGRIIGAAALTSDEVSYFKDFLIIEVDEDEEIAIDVEVSIERYQEGRTLKKWLHFDMKDLSMKGVVDAESRTGK